MSVIPLIIEGQNRTVVESRQEFEDAGGLGGEVVFIQPLAREQLLIEDDANVSYDLRVGGMYRDHRNAGGTALEQGEQITLLPGAAVIVETEETVQLPSKMFGQIVPKVTLLHEGISNTTSKVDPGYNGSLLVKIFNLGKKTRRFKRGEVFCSLYILRVDDGARPYNKPAKRIGGESKLRAWHTMRDILQRNSAETTMLLLIATLVLAVIVIFK